MTNIIVGVILLVIIGAAIAYIVKSKKSGVKCIGCPAGGSCPSQQKNKKSQETCSCGCSDSKK